MRRVHPVRISKIGFEFCRYGVAALVWLAVLFNSYEWLVATALLLGASALLKVRKAPMVVLGHFLMGGMLPDKVVVDELGMQFAHVMGFVLNIIVLAVVIFVPAIGWWVTLAFALMKTVSAAGHCSALKLYGCLNNDECCKGVKKYV